MEAVPTDATYIPHRRKRTNSQPIAIPKGTPCNYSVFLMQRNPDLFGPTVDDFTPERWNQSTPVPWTYIPFNGGPRICLGQHFALTQIPYAVSNICHRDRNIASRSGLQRSAEGYKADNV